MNLQHYCGYVAILGRPNVGKSTLLNALLGKKLSITCHKRQTTRHVIQGIKTDKNYQSIYVDTPGMHKTHRRTLNKHMNQVASHTIYDVDVVLFVVDAMVWTDEDEYVLEHIKSSSTPCILVINKIDQFQERDQVLPIINNLKDRHNFTAIVPVCAEKGTNVAEVQKAVNALLPEGEFFFEAEKFTTRDDNFIISEIVREKLFNTTHQEIPYSSTVLVEHIQERNQVLHINASIYVERPNQKAIVIGKGGTHLKLIGSQARHDLERHFDKKIFLQLWVKVKQDWADDEKALSQLGFYQ
ncbi:MAG: GTPase Era [Gammaproteobacteria bacterium CG11_big_fil_rev_8_21_14_0_20_46_22]|nr:MAG: GTPase Era [Gammaproteobacteria bacterium CG12_big_fil_rev_8_21_14_0_65_46_12]PIR11691.1 MAG: GTPase Era [Gammaproteobacteria bacterium CG11_big_fil_rev_8_21_14_0_20_46_22]